MFTAYIQFGDGTEETAVNLSEVNIEWLHECIPAKTVYFQREDGGGVVFAARRIVRIDFVREEPRVIELEEDSRHALNR